MGGKAMKNPDPRTLLLLVAILSSIVVFTKQIFVQFALLGVLLILIMYWRVPVIPFLRRIQRMFPLVIFVVLMQSIFVQGEPLIHIGSIAMLSIQGIHAGTMTLFRLTIVILSASLFTLTDEATMIQGLRQIKLPDELAYMSLIALRFLPGFVQEFQDCLIALQLRGINVKTVKLKDKLVLYQYFVTPVLIRTILKAKRLAMALELKGFRAMPQRTSLLTLRLKLSDKLTMMGFVLLAILWVYMEVMWR